MIVEGPAAARIDRRDRARETYFDNLPTWDMPEGSSAALEMCIETAMRVRITQQIVNAYNRHLPHHSQKDQLIAAFRAAGFEVEE